MSSGFIDVKYVIIDYIKPMVFVGVNHEDMKVHGEVTSAAFCKIHPDGKVETYGYSRSMKMFPKPDDADIIQMMLESYDAKIHSTDTGNPGQEQTQG